MKLFIVIFLLPSFIAQTLFAGQNYQQMANEYVVNSHKVALEDAKAYIQQDFLKMVGNAFALTESYQSHNNQLMKVRSIEQEVMDFFDSIAGLSNIEIDNVDKNELYAKIAEYEKAMRGFYALGWLNIDHEYYYQTIFSNMENSLKISKEMCRIGRGNIYRTYTPSDIANEINYSNYDFGVQPQHPVVGFLTMVGGGLPIGVNGGVNRVSASASKQANQNRALALGTTQTLAMMSLNIQLTNAALTAMGQTQLAASASAGMVNSSLLAAGPYLMAAAVVAMVINDVIVNKEAKRLQRKLIRAKKTMMGASANNQDVINYYKEYCQESMPAIESFFNKILSISNSTNKQKIVEEAEKKQEQIDSWLNASNSNDINTCRIKLESFREHVGCLHLSDFKTQSDLDIYVQTELNKSDEERDNKIQCLIDESQKKIIYTFNRDCSLASEKEDRAKELKEIEARIERFEKIYNFNKISDLASARVILILEGKDKISNELKRISFQAVEQKSNLAMGAILKYFAILRSQKSLSATSKMLVAEERAHKEYIDLKNSLILVAKKFIQVLFDDLPPKDLVLYLSSYEQNLRTFSSKYGHVPEVAELVRTFDDTKAYIHKELR